MENSSTMATRQATPLASMPDFYEATSAANYSALIDKSGTDAAAGRVESWAVLLLFPIIICSVVGNLLVCLAISRDRRLQNLTNFFLFSMAMADLMVALLVMPFGLTKDLLGYWPLGHIMCNIWTTLDVFCCTASILHMCMVSIDRYIAICYPLRNTRQPRTRCGIAFKIFVVWAFAVALSSPLCIMGFLEPSTIISDKGCAVTNVHFIIYGSVVAFFIPLCVVVVTYCLTTYTLYKKMMLYQGSDRGYIDSPHPRRKIQRTYPRFILHIIKRNGFERAPTQNLGYSSSDGVTQKSKLQTSCNSLESNGSTNSLYASSPRLGLRRTMSKAGQEGMKQLNTEQRASKVLGLVFAAFVVGWTPFFVANLTVALCRDCTIADRVFIVCTWIGWASSMVNPFIYTAFNKKFRQAFFKLLTCREIETRQNVQTRSHTPTEKQSHHDRSPLHGNLNRHDNKLSPLAEESREDSA